MDLGSLVRRLVAGSARSDSAGAGGPAVSRSADSAGPARPARGAWRTLPPIGRASGPAPLVAPNAPFEAGLASARPAPIALATLGHHVGLEAPAGLVTGLATPVQRSPADDLPASVRRPGRSRGDGTPAHSPGLAWPDPEEAPPPAGHLADPPEASVVAAVPGASSLVSSPALPAAPGGLIGRPAIARAAGLQRQAESIQSTAMPVSATSEPGSMAPSRPVPPAVPPVTSTRRIRFGSALAPGAGAATPDGGGPLVARSAAESAVRPGPAGGGLQRQEAFDTTPAVRPPASRSKDASTIARSAAADGATGHEARAVDAGGADPAAPAAPAGVRAGGDATLGAGDMRAHPDAPLTADPARPMPLRPITRAASALAPLVGRIAMSFSGRSPAVAVQRSVVGPDAATEPTGGPAAALAALAAADRFGAPERGQPGASPAFGPPGLGSGSSGFRAAGGVPDGGSPRPGSAPPGAAFVARSADEGAAPLGDRLTWTNPWFPDAGAAREPAAPHDQSAPAPARPAHSGTFQPRRGALTVGAAVQRSVGAAVQRSAPVGSGSPPGAGSPPPVPDSALPNGSAADPASAAAPAVQRSADADPAAGAALQRQDAAGTEGAAAAPGGAAGTGAPAGGSGEKELEDLARRLYERLNQRLRRELLIERERAGALVDRGF